MTTCKKLEITEDVVNNLVNLLLDVNLDEAYKISFTQELLVEKDSLKKYKDMDFGKELRKYVKLNECKKLSVKIEDELTESDLLTILRAVLKKIGHKMISDVNIKKGKNKRVYYIHNLNKNE